MAVLCLALLIALAPSIPAFAMISLMAPLGASGHAASSMAGSTVSPSSEAAAAGTRAHQHGDESVANDGGASDCRAIHSIDPCMAVCCIAILSQSLDPSRVPFSRETEFFLTIPSSASRITSHPPPEAIA